MNHQFPLDHPNGGRGLTSPLQTSHCLRVDHLADGWGFSHLIYSGHCHLVDPPGGGWGLCYMAWLSHQFQHLWLLSGLQCSEMAGNLRCNPYHQNAKNYLGGFWRFHLKYEYIYIYIYYEHQICHWCFVCGESTDWMDSLSGNNAELRKFVCCMPNYIICMYTFLMRIK